MDTVEEMDLAAAGFRREAAWLADLAGELDGGRYRDALDQEDPVVGEVRDTLWRLADTYTEAQDAYLTAKAWSMEVEHLRDEDDVGPAVARREQQRCEAVIEDYRDGGEQIDAAAGAVQEHLGIDPWDRIDPDTQVYDHAEYVDDMEFEVEYGGLFRAIDAAEALYDRAEGVYSRLT